MKYDVAVVGAGVAGLAAARELSSSGRRVCLIEARPRIGGRIHTLHLPDLSLPIELGAEFIHGDSDEIFAIVQAAALTVCELPDTHTWSRGGEWKEIAAFWETIDRVRAQIGTRRHDVSFADFLRTRRGLAPATRELVRTFVEGYHAAHADRISALALATADGEQEQPGQNKQFRILNGYDALVAWLHAGIDPARATILLGTIAGSVTWRKGDVAIDCTTVAGKRERTIRAGAALFTLPIGVWKAAREQPATLRFSPALEQKTRAIEKLEVGHVMKIVLRFSERFWDDRNRSFNFLHSSDRFVPTWWTTAPVRSTLLTAWAGGHAADALLAEKTGAIDRVLDSLATAFAMKRREIDALLVGTHSHDWQADPFSRGAYSYAGVGGTGAHKALAKPVDGTLFFAGEATDPEQTGTVAGAIASGRRAAREIARSLRPSRSSR